MHRRALLAALAGLSAAGRPAWALPARTLVFPRDHGAHPDSMSRRFGTPPI